MPVYLLGRRLESIHPFVPLSPQRRALSIGVISYDGGLYFGLVGDRDRMADLDELAGVRRRGAGRGHGFLTVSFRRFALRGAHACGLRRARFDRCPANLQKRDLTVDVSATSRWSGFDWAAVAAIGAAPTRRRLPLSADRLRVHRELASARSSRRGRLHRVHQGVYALGPAALSPSGNRIAAVLACGPGSLLAFRSAGSPPRADRELELADRRDDAAPGAATGHPCACPPRPGGCRPDRPRLASPAPRSPGPCSTSPRRGPTERPPRPRAGRGTRRVRPPRPHRRARAQRRAPWRRGGCATPSPR